MTPTHLVLLLSLLGPGLFLNVVQGHLFKLTLLGVLVPRLQLLLSIHVSHPPALQVPARIKVGGDFAIAALPSKQGPKASLASPQPKEEMEGAAWPNACCGEDMLLILQVPPRENQQVVLRRDATASLQKKGDK